jgi:CysZ protein
MLRAASLALSQIFSRDFRGILWRVVGLTLLVFVLLFWGVEWLIAGLPTLGWEWVNTAIQWVAPVLFLVLFFFLGAPVATIIVGVFLEEIADKVDARFYPSDPKAPGSPIIGSVLAAISFGLVTLGLNLLVLPIHVFLPLIGSILVLTMNGYLLGREYFELVALRHGPPVEVKRRRRANRSTLWLAGTFIAVFSMIPLVNLLAPLFGTAFMVHLHKQLTPHA